jgi:arylformamidase
MPDMVLLLYGSLSPDYAQPRARLVNGAGQSRIESAMNEAFTPEYVELQYNNRRLVPEHPEYFARWQRDSEFVRATLPGALDVPYGPDARHRIDLFPAAHARGTLLFFHGGYWRSLDKSMVSWLAASWVAAGVSVAMPSYRLCPAVPIESIVEDAIAATNWLFAHGAGHGIATERVVVSGHSAGGHLAAALFAAPRAALRFDPARIAGGVALSGIFDFAPLTRFSYNEDFRLDDAAVARLGLYDKRATIAAPLIVAAGGDESAEFQRQSRGLAESWPDRLRSLLILPGVNHFSILDTFGERGQPLCEQTLALLG